VILRHATLPDGSEADVRLDGDRIAEVAPAGTLGGEDELVDLTGYVLLPAPAEPHAHLDKALTAAWAEHQADDLQAAIEAWHARRRSLAADDIAPRAEAAARACLARGATAVRTHVDVGEGIELRAAEAMIEVRERLRPLMDIQVVALCYPLTGAEGVSNRELLRAALELGADVVGGAPHVDPDPAGHMKVCLELSAEFDRPVDLHMDEHLGSRVDLGDLAGLVAALSLPSVTASHCLSLGMRPVDVQNRIASEVAAAGISVVTCPATNLHLHGRMVMTAKPRGITALAALLSAGVSVAGGGDNAQDFFHPLGCGDPLQTASLLVLGGQLDVATAYRLVSQGARAVMGAPTGEIAAGEPAELLAVAGSSVQEVLATLTEDRIVLKGGRVVARTRVLRDEPATTVGRIPVPAIGA
jgi:cytosine/creatinine deaminase